MWSSQARKNTPFFDRINATLLASKEEEESDHLDNTNLEYQKHQNSDDLEDCLALLSWEEATRQKVNIDPSTFLQVACA